MSTGYTGSRCEEDIDDCVDNDCPEGANCVDGIDHYTCQCMDDRLGADCSKGGYTRFCIGVYVCIHVCIRTFNPLEILQYSKPVIQAECDIIM